MLEAHVDPEDTKVFPSTRLLILIYFTDLQVVQRRSLVMDLVLTLFSLTFEDIHSYTKTLFPRLQ